jgi:hypothetical protein
VGPAGRAPPAPAKVMAVAALKGLPADARSNQNRIAPYGHTVFQGVITRDHADLACSTSSISSRNVRLCLFAGNLAMA